MQIPSNNLKFDKKKKEEEDWEHYLTKLLWYWKQNKKPTEAIQIVNVSETKFHPQRKLLSQVTLYTSISSKTFKCCLHLKYTHTHTPKAFFSYQLPIQKKYEYLIQFPLLEWQCVLYHANDINTKQTIYTFTEG